MSSPLLKAISPVLEACCKALLEGQSDVLTMRQLRDLVTKLDGIMRSDRDDEAKTVSMMLETRKLIDHMVSTNPLGFLRDPLCGVLSKGHEALKNFIQPKGVLAPAARRTRVNGFYRGEA